MHRIRVLLFALVLLALPLTTVAAQNNDVIGVVNTGALNLRELATVQSGSIAEIPQGYSVVLLGRTPENTWYYVSYDPNGYTPVRGWVAARYITITQGRLEQVSIFGSDGVRATAVGVINTGALNIRSIPVATNNVPIATLYQGTTLDIIGRNADSTWLQVRFGYGGHIGWARSRYVTLTSGAPLVQLPITSDSTIPPTPVPTTSVQGVVNTGALNIRTVPRWWGNTPITFVYRSAPLTLIGRNSDSSWYQVRLADGTTGWARSRYVNLTTGNPGTLPITG